MGHKNDGSKRGTFSSHGRDFFVFVKKIDLMISEFKRRS